MLPALFSDRAVSRSLGFPRIFDDFFNVPDFPRITRSWNLDRQVIREDDNQYYAEFEVPGLRADDIQLELKNGLMTVSAKTKDRQLYYSVTVPEGADLERAEAHLDKGVLSVVMPKTERAKSRQIEIMEGP